MLHRNEMTASVLAAKLDAAKIGVVVKGLVGIDPAAVASYVSQSLQRHLHVCAVGYDEMGLGTGGVTLTSSLEQAVDWRSTPELAGALVVFAMDDAPKLHSLSDLDTVSERDITDHVLTYAESELAENYPRGNFWRALVHESATLPLELVEQFVRAVLADRSSQEAILDNLWRLGLLRDPLLIQGNQDSRQRLVRNRELLAELGLLSDESRKRLTRVLTSASGARHENLRQSFLAIQRYFRTGNTDVLKSLGLDVVEELIKAGSPIRTAATGKRNPDRNGEIGGGEVLKGKRAEQALAGSLVARGDDGAKLLREYSDALSKKLDDPQNAPDAVTIERDGEVHTFRLEIPGPETRGFFSLVCSAGSWGGVLSTSHPTIREAILHHTPEDFQAYSPDQPSAQMLGQSLFSLLRWFDDCLETKELSQTVGHLIESREALARFSDLLLVQPVALLGSSREARAMLDRYLGSFSALLRILRQHEAVIHASDAEALRTAFAEILRLDVVYIHTPTEWKAILTPLHPFHLWRYREVLAPLLQDDDLLTDAERAQLAVAIPELPHLIHFLVSSPMATDQQSVVLPQAGSLESLPTFENHTNRYLGLDGVEFLAEALRRFLAVSPYSARQLRVAVVDAPSIHAVLSQMSDFVGSSGCDRMVVDMYFTHQRTSVGDLGLMGFDEDDYLLGEQLRDNVIAVQVLTCGGVNEVVSRIASDPVHLVFFFDQAQYHIDYGPKARQLMVSPLVITHQYEYSKRFGRGSIVPSSEAEEGMFSDWHFLVQRAALLPPDQQLRMKYDPSIDLGPVNALLEGDSARWLVVSDRVLTSYAPKSAIPLGERRYGQREVAAWAKADSRVTEQLMDRLKRYDLIPDAGSLTTLLHTFGHLAGDGLLALPGPGGSAAARERSEKAFLGTILAAAWYVRTYPGAMVTSLDSSLARLWLRGRIDGDRRADLIGVRALGADRVAIEPIEVKTHEDDGAIRLGRDEAGFITLEGPAIEQLRSTMRIIRSIFGFEDGQPLLTPARKEVLKYQLHRECFRDIHDRAWRQEWYDRLGGIFASPVPKVSVECCGLAVQVRLDQNSATDIISDRGGLLAMATLGNRTLQSLVSNTVHATGYDRRSDDARALVAEAASELDPNASLPTDASDAKTIPPANPPGTCEDGEALGNRGEAAELARLFRLACQSFRVQLQECNPDRAVLGPSVWRFYVRLARGQRLDALRNSLEDIGREMRRSGLLISALPSTDEIALDIPRSHQDAIPLSRGLSRLGTVSSWEQMPIPIGVTPEGEDIVRDLGRMIHLLIGGTTGSGKTRLLLGLLVALVTTHPDPASLRILLSTSKPEDFSFFRGLPHLETGSVVSEASEAIRLLEGSVAQCLNDRGRILEATGCVNIQDYNLCHPHSRLAPLVVVVDEFADLADQLGGQKAAKEAFYTHIRRIAQLGRSRGVHLVLCTQRPSGDLVPTSIRNLMNCRIALRVNDATASRMILEGPGAEQLQMHGDLLFKDEDDVLRAQAYLVQPDAVIAAVKALRC